MPYSKHTLLLLHRYVTIYVYIRCSATRMLFACFHASTLPHIFMYLYIYMYMNMNVCLWQNITVVQSEIRECQGNANNIGIGSICTYKIWNEWPLAIAAAATNHVSILPHSFHLMCVFVQIPIILRRKKKKNYVAATRMYAYNIQHTTYTIYVPCNSNWIVASSINAKFNVVHGKYSLCLKVLSICIRNPSEGISFREKHSSHSHYVIWHKIITRNAIVSFHMVCFSAEPDDIMLRQFRVYYCLVYMLVASCAIFASVCARARVNL